MATLNIVITVPDARAVEILATLTDHFGFDPVAGIGRAEFLRQHVRLYLRDSYRTARVSTAQGEAGDPARIDAESVAFE